MPFLVHTTRNGERVFAILYPQDPFQKPRPGEIRASITDEQAAKGIDYCELLFDAGRLK